MCIRWHCPDSPRAAVPLPTLWAWRVRGWVRAPYCYWVDGAVRRAGVELAV